MYPVVGLLSHVVILFLVFKDSVVFYIVAVSVYIPTQSAGEVPFVYIHSSIFIVCRFFNDGHSGQCEVLIHFSFDLHFSNN